MISTRKLQELNTNITQGTRNFDQVRHFTLLDEYKLEMELTGKFENALDPLMTDISGMGYKKNLTTYFLGTREIVSDSSYDLGSIKGTLNFYGDKNSDKYTMLNNFKQAVGLSQKLFIKYKIPFDQQNTLVEFYPELICQVELVDNDYGEVNNKTGVIELSVEFKRLTPWRSNIMQQDFISADEEIGTRVYGMVDNDGDGNLDAYEYVEDGEVSPVYGAKASGETEVNVFGTAASYPTIIINGPTENPSITVTNKNTGLLERQIVIIGSYTDTDVITINSDPTNFSYKLNDTDNIYPQVRKGPGYDSMIALNPGQYILKYTNDLTSGQGGVQIKYVWEYN